MGETMSAVPAQTSNEDLGKLVLRVMVGALIIFHGLAVLTGDPGIPNRLVAWGLPADLKWLGFIAEFGGGVAMVLGAYARLGGLAVGFFMVAAIIMSHIGLMNSQNHLFMVAQNPGGNHWDHYFLDTQMFYMLSSFAVYFLGAGKLGLNIGGKWN
jgi:putative oxidoreductase